MHYTQSQGPVKYDDIQDRGAQFTPLRSVWTEGRGAEGFPEKNQDITNEKQPTSG